MAFILCGMQQHLIEGASWRKFIKFYLCLLELKDVDRLSCDVTRVPKKYFFTRNSIRAM